MQRRIADALDIFRVVADDTVLTGKTRHGGFLGIFCTAVISLLIVSECVRFFTPGDFKSTMSVNRREMGRRERVNFNISFLNFPCGVMQFESFQANAGLRLTKQEETLSWKRMRLLQGDANLVLGEYTTDIGLLRTLNEGCRVEGSFYIDKVPSNFVLSARGFTGIASEPPATDVIFNDFWFGEARLPVNEVPEALANALSGQQRRGDAPHTIYQYFLSIVPTVVTDSRKRGDDSRHVGFQYTAISSTVQANVPPGLYFAHHHSPIAVEMERVRETWSHFLVNIASISGGVYVVCELSVWSVSWLAEKGYLPEPLLRLLGVDQTDTSMLK